MWISKQSPIRCPGAIFGNSMDSVSSVQNKNFSGKKKRAYKSSWSRRRTLKSFTRTIPWSLAKPVKTCPGIIVRRHLTVQRQMALQREQHAELKKELQLFRRNQVWMKNGVRSPWNVTAICEMFKISCLMGKLHTRDVSENLLKDQLFHLVQWLNTNLIPRKTSQESIN